MPSNNLAFRTACGSFYWTFQYFMYRRTREAAAMRQCVRPICVSGRVAVALVFVSVLLLCGDVHPHPGPANKKQSTLTAQAPSTPLSSGNEKNNPTEPSLADVMKMLSSMDKKIENMHETTQEQLNKVHKEMNEVLKENKDLKEKISTLENKVDDLEGRSRRKNLIFHGIPYPRGQTEKWSDCEEAVKSVLKNELGIAEDVEIERAHRLQGNGKSPSPVIVSFDKFKTRERVLASRRTLREKKSNIFINEDFTPRVRDVRRSLLPFLKRARAEEKRAFLRFDTLVMEGKTYVYDPSTQGLKERQGRK